MAIYMDFDGIKGDVTTADYKGWIELNSFQFGVSRGVSSGADDDLADAGRGTLTCRAASTAADPSRNAELKRVKLDPTLVVRGRHIALDAVKVHIDCHSRPP